MRVFEFYRQKPGLAREIPARLGCLGNSLQRPSCFDVDQSNHPRTRQVGLATKMNDGHSAENSEEPFISRQGVEQKRFNHGLPCGPFANGTGATGE